MPFRRLLLVCGLVVYAISWASLIEPFEATTIYGWEAYRITAMGGASLFTNASGWSRLDPLTFLWMLSPHTNYIMAVAFVAMGWNSPRKLRVLAIALAAATAINATWLVDPTGLQFGYYLWLFSFPIIASAVYLEARAKRGIDRAADTSVS